jgi:hypothetical protein
MGAQMSLEEKKAWSFLTIALLGYGVYLVLALSAAATQPVANIDYASPMLWTIGGAIVAGIVAGIVITVVSPRDGRQSDQRDRDIARLGEHVGQAFLVIGGVGALILALIRADHFWIANVVYLGFVLSAVVGSAARLIAYRRGVPTW